MHIIVVTAAIIAKGNAILLTKRPQEKHNGGRWEFPGGKIEFGEEPRDCLKREIKEELGIDIEVGDIFDISSHVYDEKKHILLLAFHCAYLGGEIQKHDIADYAWVEDFSSYDITEADLPFIKKLKVV
jgi:8-oxo-dGTP diphosphatase